MKINNKNTLRNLKNLQQFIEYVKDNYNLHLDNTTQLTLDTIVNKLDKRVKNNQKFIKWTEN
jgi:hypothetical protein